MDSSNNSQIKDRTRFGVFPGASIKEAWAVLYAHGGIISEFSSKSEAHDEAERWNGFWFRLKT